MASFTLVCVVGLALVGASWAQLTGLAQSNSVGPLGSTGGGMGNVPYGGSYGTGMQNGMGGGGGGSYGNGMGGGMQNQNMGSNLFSNPWSGLMMSRFLDVNPLYAMMLGGLPNGQGNNNNQAGGGGNAGGGMFGNNFMLPLLYSSMIF